MRMNTKGYLKTFEGALLHMLLRIRIERIERIDHIWEVSSPLTHEIV